MSSTFRSTIPQAVYAPPPANIPPPTTVNVSGGGTTTVTSADGTTTTVAPAATTAAATTTGHSTGSLITTGLLAFGAGMLVNEMFDDDDDWDNYGPNYYHGGMYYGGRPYYPPPPYMYRPPYGNGYNPAHNYNRPPNYQHGFNNNTIIVNNGGNNYWNRQSKGSTNARSRKAQSPITAANPEAERSRQPESPGERSVQARIATAAAGRDASPGGARQSGYAGAKPENKAARDSMVAKSPPAGVARDLPTRPKTEYKGANNRPTGAKPPASASRLDRREPTPRNARIAAAAACRFGRSWPRQTEATHPSAGRPLPRRRSARTRNPRQPRRSRAIARHSDPAEVAQKSGKSEHKASQRGKASTGAAAAKPRSRIARRITMKNHLNDRFSSTVALAMAAVLAVTFMACAKISGHASFASADEAVAALIEAGRKPDAARLEELFGPGSESILSSGDAVADKNARDNFLKMYDAKHSLVPEGDDKVILQVGSEDWPMPVPVVKKDGQWYFDGAEGADEIVYRRIGHNELGAISVCRGYVDAQHEYAAADHDGEGAGVYANKLVSDEGTQNGLYWKTVEGEPASPIGPFIASAASEGYKVGRWRLPRLSLPAALQPDGQRQRRRDRLLRQGRAEERLRAHRLAGRVRRERRDDLHRQPGRRRVPEGPGR